MSDANQLRAAYERYNKTVDQVITFGRRMSEAEETITAATKKIIEVQEQRKNMRVGYMAGNTAQAEIDEASAKWAALDGEIKEAKAMLLAGRTAHQTLIAERQRASDEYQKERETYCYSFSDSMEKEIFANSGIRSQLVEILAVAIVAISDRRTADRAWSDWSLVVQNAFPPPDQAEVDAAVERFKSKHITSVLGADAS